jgi:hypothetical protein
MFFTIADGSQKDITAGKMVMVKQGYLPPEFDGKFIEIKDVSEGYPMAQLEPDQLSGISPELILVVV